MRSAVEKQGPPKMIAKPKGNADKNYSLITEMGLDRGNPKENTLYNNILVSPNSRYHSIKFATEKSEPSALLNSKQELTFIFASTE